MTALTVILLAVLLAASGVRADGDPASDVLLVRNVFFTYAPPPSPQLQRTLNQEVAAATAAQYRVKVALIRSPLDLGLVPELFGKPQQYADFLGQEISLQYKGPLLVVMPGGYGVHRVTATARAEVAGLPSPASARIDDLARSAIAAVAKLAAGSGHPIAVPSGASRSGGSALPVIAAIGAGLAIVIAAALVAVRHRRSTDGGPT